MFERNKTFLQITIQVLLLVHFSMQTISQNEISKCCNSSEILEFTASGFVQCHSFLISESLTPNSFPYSNASISINADMESQLNETLIKTTGFPHCSDVHKFLKNSHDIWFRINVKNEIEVGLLWPFEPIWISIPKNAYCIHELYNQWNTTNSEGVLKTKQDKDLRNFLLFLCPSDVPDYQIYLISRYVVGAFDLLSVGLFIAVVVIYLILREIHNVVGWLICTLCGISVLLLTTYGILTIVNAEWLDVETTTTCEVFYSMARYLQMAVVTGNLVAQVHMLHTFWKMTKKIKAVDRSIDKLKVYLPIIIMVPTAIVIVDQTIARIYWDSKFVKHAYKFGYGRCSPPETEFFDHCMSVMLLLTLILAVASGIVIVFLRLSSSGIFLTNDSSSKIKKQFFDTSKLFLKLLLGSGAPLIIRFLAFLYIGKEDPLKWYFTAIFCATQLFTSVYHFFAFAFTAKHRALLRLIREGKPINSITVSSKVSAKCSQVNDPNASTKNITSSSV